MNDTLLGLGEQAHVLHGDSDLVSENLERAHLVALEAVRLDALHVQRAEDMVAHLKRQRDFGAGFRQQRVEAVRRAAGLGGVVDYHRLARCRRLPDH